MDAPGPYVAEPAASAYLAGRMGLEGWEQATEPERTAALLEASERIDALVWVGLPLTEQQPRAWPRRLVDASSMRVVEKATVFEAAEILSINALPEDQRVRAALQAQGVTAFTNGPLSETYGDGAGASALASYGLQSERALRILRPYLVTRGEIY